MEPLQTTAGEVDLVHAAATQRDDRVDLFHHVDIVQAIQPLPAPAHVLEGTGHIFLPVQIIGLIAVLPQRFIGIGHHLRHILCRGQFHPPLEEVRTLLQGQRMHRDVGRLQSDHLIQGPAEALHRIRRQPGDQIHIDRVEAGLHRLTVGPEHILPPVRPSRCLQHGIRHGLGIDAHAVRSMVPDRPELFKVQRIRPTALHRELDAPAQIQPLPDRVQQADHLFRGQGGGSTASDIQGTHLPAGAFQKLSRQLQFFQKRIEIRLHQLRALAHRPADEAAIGATGGTEGDAHIQGNIPGLQLPHGLHRGPGAIHRQRPPLRCHIVHVL